jgi:hypothetical protein
VTIFITDARQGRRNPCVEKRPGVIPMIPYLLFVRAKRQNRIISKNCGTTLKLNSANIEITGDTGGSSPMNVVNYGFLYYRDYDHTFCVIVKDKHTNYQLALDKVRDKKQRKGHLLRVVTSVPCFEFWLLLHFRKTTRNFDTGQGSICEQVISELKRHMPDYAKGTKGTYGKVKPQLATAIRRAKEVLSYCESSDTDHPSTQIHELVVYLQGLKKQ